MLYSDDFSNTISFLVNNNMPLPTKMATYRVNYAVLVTVYVEKPRRRVSSNNHHHYLHHSTINQHKHSDGAGKGYDRRAELLHYSRRLKESARSAVSTSSQSKPVPSNDHQRSNKVISTVQRKPKYSKTPACFDSWGIFIPSFIRSLTKPQSKKSVKKMTRGGSASSNNNNNKMKAAMKSLQMLKKWRFFSKMISMFHTHR